MDEAKLLICEGPCNPLVRAIDEHLRQGHDCGHLVRGLSYTPHVRVTPQPSVPVTVRVFGDTVALRTEAPVELVPDRYACQTCGTVRQFGYDLIAIGMLA